MAHGWRTNWPLTAAVVWGLGLVGLGVEAYLKPTGRTVFDIYRIAGRQWWDGEDLYPRQAATHELYRYSPAFAALEAPFALLPPGAGNAAWKVFNGGAFALAVWVWCRRLLSLTRNQSAAVVLLCIPGCLQSLHIGQANLLMTAFVLLGLTAAGEDRWWLAASCVAAATLIKVFPFALGLVLAVLFWRTFPLRFFTALLAGLTLPFLTQRPEYALGQTRQWFAHMVESTELNRDRLRSLDKVLEVIGAGVEPKVFLLIGALAGAVVLGMALGMTRLGVDCRGVLARVGAWFLTWAVLFGPSTENPTFAILAPVVAAAVVIAFSDRRVGLQTLGAMPTALRGHGLLQEHAHAKPWAWHTPFRVWFERLWLLASLYLIGLSTTDAGGPLKHFFHDYFGTTTGAVMFQVWLIVEAVRAARMQKARRTGSR